MSVEPPDKSSVPFISAPFTGLASSRCPSVLADSVMHHMRRWGMLCLLASMRFPDVIGGVRPSSDEPPLVRTVTIIVAPLRCGRLTPQMFLPPLSGLSASVEGCRSVSAPLGEGVSVGRGCADGGWSVCLAEGVTDGESPLSVGKIACSFLPDGG